jgi:glycosyltransferase involved in cell wall biosynthesis
MKVAYLSNCFPSAVEPYVMDEILALRARGIEVVASSARRPDAVPPSLAAWAKQTLYLQVPRVRTVVQSLIRCCCARRVIRPFLVRLLHGEESLVERTKALVHTFIGVYYAVLLENQGVNHIHVHHGYFSSWIAMVAARLLGISYSMTLHGSDLLLRSAYLDLKLEHCNLCFTISEYNRQAIFHLYPKIPEAKIILRRLGVQVPDTRAAGPTAWEGDHRFVILVPGRLHAVKNHEFLVSACAILKARSVDFMCFIAGDGPQRKSIENRIRRLELQREIKLLGHVAHEDLEAIYPLADLVVLTSKSEGIPLVLMEAMGYGCAVLAPNITGIPELVIDGKTGFLYEPGSFRDFVDRVEFVHRSLSALGPVRRAARDHVSLHFNRARNLEAFMETLSAQLAPRVGDENPVLQ